MAFDRRTERTECDNCQVAYAARLTAGHCPVCGTASESHRPAGRRLQDRFVTVAIAAMVVNLLLLGWLATLYLRA